MVIIYTLGPILITFKAHPGQSDVLAYHCSDIVASSYFWTQHSISLFYVGRNWLLI